VAQPWSRKCCARRSDASRPDGLAPEFGLSEHSRRLPLSDAQAQAILELRLQRLTGLEQDKIVSEYKEVMADHRSARHPGQAGAHHRDHRRTS
jgi:hypothetical protein